MVLPMGRIVSIPGGMLTWLMSRAAGVNVVGSRDFNGTTDRIDWANVANLAGTTCTISLWVKTDAVAHNSYCFCIHNSGDSQYGFTVNIPGDTAITSIRHGTTDYIWNATGVTDIDGAWHNILVTSDGGLLSGSTVIYFDGESQEMSFVNGSGAEVADTGSWSLGGRIYSDTRNLDGKLAQVGVWNRVLHTSEIVKLAAGYAADLVAASDLLFYFKGNTSSLAASPGGTGTADGTTHLTGAGNGPNIIYSEADMQLDIQTFTSDGTWTKPANALSCQILIVDGGTGGNGGGYAEAAGVPGSGGAYGMSAIHQVPECILPATVAVTIGAGGAGGIGSIGEAGAAGVAGIASSFGVFTAGCAWDSNFPEAFSGADGYTQIEIAGTGGTGGDIDGAGVDGNGVLSPVGDGGSTFRWSNGGAGGAAHANGSAGSALSAGGGGGGGGGGAVTATSAGGNGGAGGAYGGGGGGGGSGDGTFTGGDGGAGADGVVIVWTVTA